ncbi:Ku DNA-binding complex, Ku70 subunit [Rickenella mellea]|uniref:ATP-dependent DNA helicase II subunit 1 n=1 Tax=Rickenella mellea TaxID=50990 RepID=A0A4Y7QEN3_9AGAM|nr:Ku DNA-binding complex, Ku70 subunit [Rickenella mellea]
MAPYDDWNKADEDEEDELQDASTFEGQRDVVLFCIDASESMHAVRDDPNGDGAKTSHLYTALETAMQVQKRKVVVGPNDSVGILLFNTSRKNESEVRGSTEYKNGTYVFQSMSQVNAPKIQELMRLLHEFREDTDFFNKEFPPMEEGKVPMGDVFTSCNWALRDGAPKTGIKRIFLITNEDNPHPGPKAARLVTSAKTTLIDLTQTGVTIEPFFISTPEKPFDPTKFWSSVLPPSFAEDDDEVDESLLPASISISRIEDLLAQMRFREQPKRAQFSVPFELAQGLVIGVKGYGLITEQKKGSYKYFTDLGDRMEVVEPKTLYVDEDEQNEVDKSKILYGMTLGATSTSNDAEDDSAGFGSRVVPTRNKVFFTAEEVQSFRTLGLEPGIKLLGFKDLSELAFEDNTRHSTFIYPDETTFSGSRRTFTALMKTLIKKGKIGIVRVLMRRNSSPLFCALLPQAEKTEESGWTEPGGFHLIPLPFADDLRAAPIEEACRASNDVREAAKAWISKLQIKNGSYPPDGNPNPALAFHYAQLEASAFREEYDPESFDDLTEPKYDMIHKRAGAILKEWKAAVLDDQSASTVIVHAGSKRKADVSIDEGEIRSKHKGGQLSKLKVDELKEFLKAKSQPVSGKKADLIDRVSDWLVAHP